MLRVTIDISYGGFNADDTVCFADNDWQALDHIDALFGADMVRYFTFHEITPELHDTMRDAWETVRQLYYPYELAMHTLQAIKNARNEHDITRALITAREECA